MTMAERLLLLANELAKQSGKGQALKRRSVSTAYYAVFHALAKLCARELFDHEGTLSSTSEYERVYRALDHGSLKDAFKKSPLKDSKRLKKLGNNIAILQSERIRSDYLPPMLVHTQAQCEEWVAMAQSTLDLLSGLTPEERRTLAVHLIFKNRSL